MKRSERLFALVSLLRRRRTGVTVQELAARFEVDVRTMHRDLAALRDQGLPIVGDPGRGGGVRLVERDDLPPLGLSVGEALSLWISYRLARLLDPTPIGADLAPVVDKVLAGVPSTRRAAIERVLSRVVITAPAGRRLVDAAGPVNADVYRAVERGFTRGEAVQLRYRDANGRVSEREVEPHGLLVASPLWYVLAIDPAKGARTFRLDRILGATPSGRTFTPLDPRTRFDEIREWKLEIRA
ncbi:MAG: WYL domain-containing protein [Sandaracinus sp.]|nr:WYL domain-containing protein [Sandaracinus sp.]